MNLPRPHPGRLTVAAALAIALPVAAVAWGQAGSSAPTDDDRTTAVPAALADAASAATTPPTTPAPAAPSSSAPQPRTLGDDPVLDDLWHRCEQGSGAACDQLFQQAPLNSDYESFGLSCGNRPDVLRCTEEMDAPATTLPPPTLPAPMSIAPTTAPAPTPDPAPAGEAAAAPTPTVGG
ncbi:MAG: hypothetical protein R2761_13885 [Acidimicrobiales bacterium]